MVLDGVDEVCCAVTPEVVVPVGRALVSTWLEAGQIPGGRGQCPSPLAVEAWNVLGGLEWQGIETVAEMLGLRDIERLVAELTVIRDFQRPE